MQLIITVTYSSLSEAKVTEGYVIYWSYCATLRCSCGRTAGGRDTVFLLCRLSVWFIHTTSGSHNVAVTATAVPTFDSGPMYTKTMCCNDGRISQLCSFSLFVFFFSLKHDVGCWAKLLDTSVFFFFLQSWLFGKSTT